MLALAAALWVLGGGEPGYFTNSKQIHKRW